MKSRVYQYLYVIETDFWNNDFFRFLAKYKIYVGH